MRLRAVALGILGRGDSRRRRTGLAAKLAAESCEEELYRMLFFKAHCRGLQCPAPLSNPSARLRRSFMGGLQNRKSG